MTRIKQINRWQRIVDVVVTDYRKLDAACNAALEAGAMDSGGKLYDAIWKSHSDLLAFIDVDGWIGWYIYENACGEKEKEAKGCGRKKLRPIKTTRDLAHLIVESEELYGQND